MSNIEMILEKLRSHSTEFKSDYFIPAKWNYFGYDRYTVSSDRPGEIRVNPYDFYAECIDKYILNGIKEPEEDGSEKNRPLTESVIYAMLPRMFTAWPHNGEHVSLGSFLKCIALLPFLKQFGTDILYLLPVFKCSRRYRKGDLGCPYSIKNVYELDEEMHDPLLTDTDVRFEFKAFIEACHLLNIRVMLDFVFRTIARDSDLVYEHPDWFYWIKQDYEASFKPPYIDTDRKNLKLNDQTLKLLYSSQSGMEYQSMFSFSPEKVSPQKWAGIKEKAKTGKDMFDSIVSEIGVTTVPGFSDVINDQQPPWTDVTYLKFYYDCHPEARQFIKPDQPPCIMQDGASLNKYHGKEKITEAWDYISGVIPYYVQEYGIDGARIDMAHALPGELSAEIISRARQVKSDLILWSEELSPANGGQAAKDGFDFISGFTYYDYKYVEKSSFNHRMLSDALLKSNIPVVASLETPDTPRSAFIHNNYKALNMLVVLNGFMPNTIPMVNNGQELLEIQPMNLGLDNNEHGRFVLPESDPNYGKIAFFDKTDLHWLNDSEWLTRTIRDSLCLRKRFLKILSNPDNFRLQPELLHHKKLTMLCYCDGAATVFALANRSTENRARIALSKLLPQRALLGRERVLVHYSKGALCSFSQLLSETILMDPCGIIIGSIGI